MANFTGPLVSDRGINLQPNTLTQVGFQENNVARLPKPYKSNCFASWNESGYPEVQKFRPHMTYSIAVRVIEIIKAPIYFQLILPNGYFSHVVNFVFPKAQSNFATAFTLYTLFFLGWPTWQLQSHVIYLWVVSTSININTYLFEHHRAQYVCSF